MKKHTPRKAFTLIELLVVIAIIGLLISIILPSLGNARKTAWTVICQSTLRQLGIATQLYLDDQKDPQFLDLHTGPTRSLFWQVGVVDILQPYLGNAGNKPFDCAAAKGLSSVRDPINIPFLQAAGRIHTLPYPGFLGGIQPITTYTEYWFNDAWDSFRDPPQVGVSARKIRLIKRPDTVVWATDALDEYPRHQGKGNKGRVSAGRNNLLFGDQSIKLLSFPEYYESYDKYGAPPPFWNWGHNYPP